jgi:hypothetical protein
VKDDVWFRHSARAKQERQRELGQVTTSVPIYEAFEVRRHIEAVHGAAPCDFVCKIFRHNPRPVLSLEQVGDDRLAISPRRPKSSSTR